ncbi:hypothetical protein H5410_020623 [Solanum commersonii]|uniref:SANTA domain-containing protein n=1 Tax=Solanum commersonii TaxID=4109 RepID=A0A9J5ZET2_SOLCO|nr:hypothetical protein H5410_020623 [Solanum commersonii]
MEDEEEAFPNEDELHVASALLLLSNTHSPSPKVKCISEISQIAALSYTSSVSDSKSKSTDSSIVTADDDDTHSPSPKMKIISEISQIAALSYTTSVSDSKSKSTDSSTVTVDDDDTHSASPMRRSKSLCISDCLKISSSKPKSAFSLATSCTSASSCVSIGSTAAGDISSGGSCEANRVVPKERECVPRKMKVIFSANMQRRAEAILKVLSSHGCASEVRIRQLLGDSPDTSKALRILLRLEEVKRTGAGGRTDPYVYVVYLYDWWLIKADIGDGSKRLGVYLYDWWLIKVEIGDGSKRLGIGGFTAKEKPDGRVFHSTTIAKRHDTATLVTVDGITILLSGFINRCRTVQNGFSSEVCQHFLLGFPYNWEESAAVSFGESTNENAASVISDFSESANTSADCTSSSFTMSVDHLPANVLRDLLISGAGDPEGGMLRKSIFNEIVQKYGNNAFNVDKASCLNQKSGNEVTPQSPSLNGSPSQKKKAKTTRKQEDSYIPDAKSGKEDLPEATPKDMPEKRFLDRLLHRSGDDVPTAGENSCLNQKSGNQVTSRGPSLDETPSKMTKTAANLRKEDDNHVPDAQCRKEVLQKCNDESGTDIDKNSSSSSPLIRDKASLYKKTKVHQTQEDKRAVHKVSGQGDFGIVNTTNSSNGPLTRSRAKKKWLKEQDKLTR